MNRNYFGTDGVRGAYGGPVINERFAARLGRAAGEWAAARAGGAGRAVIGRDPRSSGASLAVAVAAGLQAAGWRVEDLGMVPTPAVARAAQARGAFGVVVTASHNPAGDNGIKFFTRDGLKLEDEEEATIEALLRDEVPAEAVRWAETAGDAGADYVAATAVLLPTDALAGWRIALDTANGATVATSAAVLERLGATLLRVGDEPRGGNINDGVGSEHPEQMAALVRAQGARLGVAHDGDGDRGIFCDETGAVLDGDEVLGVLARHALARGTLGAKTLVTTVQSNLGLDAAVGAAGGRVERTPVGDRHVAARMRSLGATLGGESSGHLICADVATTGDGLVAALRVIKVILETGQPLSELRRQVTLFPQCTGSLRVAERRALVECATLKAEIAAVEREFGAEGRVLVRYSGTEPKLRFLVEGPELVRVKVALARLQAAAAVDLPRA